MRVMRLLRVMPVTQVTQVMRANLARLARLAGPDQCFIAAPKGWSGHSLRYADDYS